MKFLNGSNAKTTNLMLWILRVVLAVLFVYESLYSAMNLYYAMPYLDQFASLTQKVPLWLFIVVNGLFSYLIYFIISNLLYNLSAKSFGMSTGEFTKPFMDKNVYRINLDFAFACYLLVAGSFNFLYFAYSLSFLFMTLIKLPFFVAAMLMFYFLISKQVPKSQRKLLLGTMLIPFAIAILFL